MQTNTRVYTERERAVSATSANEQRLLREGCGRVQAEQKQLLNAIRASLAAAAAAFANWLEERRRSTFTNKGQETQSKIIARVHIQINCTIEPVLHVVNFQGPKMSEQRAPRAQNVPFDTLFPFFILFICTNVHQQENKKKCTWWSAHPVRRLERCVRRGPREMRMNARRSNICAARARKTTKNEIPIYIRVCSWLVVWPRWMHGKWAARAWKFTFDALCLSSVLCMDFSNQHQKNTFAVSCNEKIQKHSLFRKICK